MILIYQMMVNIILPFIKKQKEDIWKINLYNMIIHMLE